MKENLIYVGTKVEDIGRFMRMITREVFLCSRVQAPARGQHYAYYHGPFKTLRAAKYAVHFRWYGNPHYIDVKECEEAARELDRELRKKPRTITKAA
jgi:hypothetical protein